MGSLKMAESIENKLSNLNVKTDINILLLGTTGVGKSTLINSFANYLTYPDLKAAKKDKLMVLIPTLFNITDKNGHRHEVYTGEDDKNETLKFGESATQDVKTYVFPIWNGQIKIRLIDTPGMGDTRGIKQDDTNSENILSYISNLHELHAICFLLKPNESRNTVFFHYCMNQIFSRLDKSACDNIIFCFTNTRGTDYSPGETVSVLRKAVDDIASRPPFAKISLNRNIFCFDNEPFRYLAAVKKNIEFESEIKDKNKESWTKSAAQCWNLIHYITGDKNNPPLPPHFVKNTNAVNEVRRIINQLAQPLAEITQLIQMNVQVLDRHKDLLKYDNASLEEMKKNLYMPVIAMDTINLTQPVTVCATRKCADIVKVSSKNSWHYKQRCHDPCYLTNVPKEIIGAPELMHCAAMGGTTNCKQCLCDFKVHMHVYYLTKLVEKNEIDQNMQKKITNREQLIESKHKVMKDIEQRQKELNNEHNTVVKCCAKFAHFLQNNAITPFNDSYKGYIEYLIDREKSLGKLSDKESIKHLQDLLLEYVELKQRFEEALKACQAIGREDGVDSKEINESIQELFKLKHNGRKIKELYHCQKNSRNKEFKKTEYIHNEVFSKKDDDKKGQKSKDKSKKTDNNERKDRDKSGDRNRQRNRGNIKLENKKARPVSPPPSYLEINKNQKPQRSTNASGNTPTQYNRGPPPPLMPSPQVPYYQSGDAGYNPQSHYGPRNDQYNATIPHPDGRKYDIQISVNNSGEPSPSTAPRNLGYPNAPYHGFNYPYPQPPYGGPHNYGAPPPPYSGPPNAGQHFGGGYPSYGGPYSPYNGPYGAQAYGNQPPSNNQGGNRQNFRGRNRGGQNAANQGGRDYRGSTDGGKINKKGRNRGGKDTKKEFEKKKKDDKNKTKKGTRSSSSDSSDSSSD